MVDQKAIHVNGVLNPVFNGKDPLLSLHAYNAKEDGEAIASKGTSEVFQNEDLFEENEKVRKGIVIVFDVGEDVRDGKEVYA